MTRRRIFFWMGLAILFVFGLSQEGLTKETYKVKRGDTLAKIADQLGVSVKELQRANGLKKTALKPGQVLSVSKSPSKKSSTKQVAKSEKSPKFKSESYTVKKGDTLQGISKKYGVSVAELKAMNRLRNHALKPGQKLALAKRQAAPAVTNESKHRQLGPVLNTDDEEILLEDDSEDGEPLNEDWEAVERDKQASAELLGKWNSPKERQIFVRVVKGFLGTPYRLGGSSVRGIDCSGFVAKVYQFFDVKLPRTAREQSRMGVRVAKNELEEGDLVFFNTRRAFGHVGIYIGNNEFIHASSGQSGKNVRIDSLDKPYYNQRFIKAVRVKGMKSVKSGERDLS
ncbi:MAG: D-gamma-glutamyl-meso-diaminopimelic acid endopeptidase CwlS precursor [Syntrophus sp. PtaU1.Bin208]|nr:MAG: D-gamma-glutamyl-meso-diaminopimelic acid endopeptidase CwlS precursor [Syntrophus sp. PtaU1.Bin208]